MKKILFTAIILCSLFNPIRAQEKVNSDETTAKIIDGKIYVYYKDKPYTGVLIRELKIDNDLPIQMEIEYMEGLKHGKAVTTFSDGKISTDYYVNGGIEGLFEEYYTNGQLKKKCNYSNGKLDGELLFYTDNGSLFYRINYSSGKNIGIEYFGPYEKLLSKHSIDSLGMGTLTDFRDNETYKTITFTNYMGEQRTWMGQNLNYKTELSISFETNKKLRKKYPDMKDAGMAYNYAEALVACPIGWDLPNAYDWEGLKLYFGGRKAATDALKSTKYWKKNKNGTNSSGFNALPTGGFRENGSIYLTDGTYTSFWTSVSLDNTRGLQYGFSASYPVNAKRGVKEFLQACRCVMFDPEEPLTRVGKGKQPTAQGVWDIWITTLNRN